MAPLVSVIIIFYNAERFLLEAIESVLAQSLPDWELILADDGSTDQSTAQARAWAEAYPGQILYVEHEGHGNRGMSATRNLGVRHSRAKWIAFLDSDDVWQPFKLAEQSGLLQAHPEARLLYGSPLYWFSWSRDLAAFRDIQPGTGVPDATVVHPPELLLRNYPLGTGPAPCPSDLIVSRAVIDLVGGFEESFRGIYQMYEDQAFLARVYRVAPVLVSNRCWTRYRQHSSACSSTVRDAGRYHDVRQYFLRYLEGILRREEEQDPRIWSALRRAWWPYRHPLLAWMANLWPRIRRRIRRDLASIRRAGPKALPPV